MIAALAILIALIFVFAIPAFISAGDCKYKISEPRCDLPEYTSVDYNLPDFDKTHNIQCLHVEIPDNDTEFTTTREKIGAYVSLHPHSNFGKRMIGDYPISE